MPMNPSIPQGSVLKHNQRMAKVDKEKFDALLKRMLQARPAPKATIETSRKTKVGKIIPDSSKR
jgi:hypothetical protein